MLSYNRKSMQRLHMRTGHTWQQRPIKHRMGW